LSGKNHLFYFPLFFAIAEKKVRKFILSEVDVKTALRCGFYICQSSWEATLSRIPIGLALVFTLLNLISALQNQGAVLRRKNYGIKKKLCRW